MEGSHWKHGGLRRLPIARKDDMVARTSGSPREGWSVWRLCMGIMLYGSSYDGDDSESGR